MSPTNPRRESTHEPLSPPRSPVYDEMLTRPHATVEDEDDEDDRASSPRSSAPSSPPTSVDASIKPETFTNPPSGRTSLSSVDTRNNTNGNDDGGQFRLPSLTLSQFSEMRSEGEEEDDFTYQRQHESPLEDPESQWESEGPPPPKQHRRKSATPASAKAYPRSARPSTSTSSSKIHLQPQSSSRRTTHFYSSRASSASYSETVQGDRKAPLVLLHITLLFLPGAEEAILRKITPTILERGLLVEHPRGDYQLLEELIIDSLGLDDALVPGQDDEEHEQDEWEKSLGVRRVKAKSKWEIRVYAANGLMTAGAWKRVWGEMERVDVEVGPKGWRGKKVSALSR
ncbi:hypothetical protein BDD12DRAFT_855080 [Trichophaea hybrida]|nr:hypothetical protein BDD12DRAFT_855080 [Trichophaea hybrida]